FTMSYVCALSLLVDGFVVIFFFQAEDGIRDRNVTGVQTCALAISYCLSSTFVNPRLSSWKCSLASTFSGSSVSIALCGCVPFQNAPYARIAKKATSEAIPITSQIFSYLCMCINGSPCLTL